MTNRRQRQVAELLHQEISRLIQRRARDPRLGFATVTGVEMSPDLRMAHVYVSVLGDEEEVKTSLASLRGAAGFFRRELGASLGLRYVPELQFRPDESLERALRIDQLLDSLKDDPSESKGNAE